MRRTVDLPHRAVLVALALHDQDGHTDMSQRVAELPVAEFGIEPGTGPVVERIVGVGVQARASNSRKLLQLETLRW